jgi:hypothetical protein
VQGRLSHSPASRPLRYMTGNRSLQKYYKLLTIYLRQFVKHAKEGNKLDSHYDILDHIWQQLYAKANQRIKRRQNSRIPISAIP